MTYAVSDKLSFPCFVNFRYGHLRWDVDGTATGIFFPFVPLELAAMPGPVAYENENTWWDVAAGFGAKFTLGGMDMKATAAYIHVNFDNDYDQSNTNNTTIFVPAGARSDFEEHVSETRDVISLGIAAKKDFTPALTGEVGLRYDLGWGTMDLNRDYLPGFNFLGTVPLLGLLLFRHGVLPEPDAQREGAVRPHRAAHAVARGERDLPDRPAQLQPGRKRLRG